MRNLILFDTQEQHENMLPLSYTRPVSHFRIGIMTIEEKWKVRLGIDSVGVLVPEYLTAKFPCSFSEENLFVDSSVLPDCQLVDAVLSLKSGESLVKEGGLIAACAPHEDFASRRFGRNIEYEGSLRRLRYIYDVFLENGAEIESDYRLITSGRDSQPLPEGNMLIGGDCASRSGRIFIEPGAVIRGGAVFNVEEGPIYIGVDSEVMERALVRGPFALGSHAKVNMGTKIYPGTTVGIWSKVGGELNNAVIFGYSNKSHDGFLGNAVVGEWCNIGAGVNASNLKNDYSKIRLWNYPRRSFLRTGLQFCGLIMGDHSKIGVNCMLNTATTIGVGVNFHGAGFPRPFVPSFLEGSCQGFKDVPLERFFSIAAVAMSRRGVELTEADRDMFRHIDTLARRYK